MHKYKEVESSSLERDIYFIIHPLIHRVELRVEAAKTEMIKWIITTAIAVAAITLTAVGIGVTVLMKAIK